MNAAENKPEIHPRRGGYPLLALFFVVAAAAILVALLAPVIPMIHSDQISKMEFWVSSAIVCGGGMAIGFFIGLYHYRRVFGAGLGIATGAAIGIIVGPVVVSPNYNQVMATCLGGSLLLFILGAACRIVDHPVER